jgi:transcriptional regulator GlxA family with amidase domain
MNPKVNKVVTLMQNDLSYNQSVQEMAKAVRLSPSHLRHLFKIELGLSPKRCQQSVRMREAKRLLESTALSMKEIANMIGIRDASHFSKSFKLVYGVTPTNYRLNIPQKSDVTHAEVELELADGNKQRFGLEISELAKRK